MGSAELPLRLTLKTRNHGDYLVMWKTGDDLRQDGLILQMLGVADTILKEVKMDLKLTPYPVMACSAEGRGSGFVEFVPETTTVFDVLKDNTIDGWLREMNPRNVEGAMDN